LFELKSYDPGGRKVDSALRQQTPAQAAKPIVSSLAAFRQIRPSLLLIATIWLVGGIFVSLPFVAAPGTLTGNALVWVSLGTVAWLSGLITILAAGTLLLNRMAAAQMAAPIVRVSSVQVRRGDRLELTYTQEFKKKTRIQSVTISFAMRETVTYTTSSETKTISYSWVFVDEQRPGRVMQPGALLEENIFFDIPPQAMHTFVTRHNRIQWFARVKVDIPQGPDINNIYEIIVLPEPENG
jgi:hypothetical protein